MHRSARRSACSWPGGRCCRAGACESGDLAVRRVPARYAPAGSAPLPELVLGRRLAVAVPAGAPVGEHLLAVPPGEGTAVRRGERATEVIATGSPRLVTAGAHVDVLVTRERGSGAAGATTLALEDVEVLAARAAPGRDGAAPQVAATLRVTVRQAVYLAAAGAFAREIRLLPRGAGRPPACRRTPSSPISWRR